MSEITKNESHFEDICKKESKYLVVAEKTLKFLQTIEIHQHLKNTMFSYLFQRLIIFFSFWMSYSPIHSQTIASITTSNYKIDERYTVNGRGDIMEKTWQDVCKALGMKPTDIPGGEFCVNSSGNAVYVIAEYALRNISAPIGVSEYTLSKSIPTDLKGSLPTVEEIEAELNESAKED